MIERYMGMTEDPYINIKTVVKCPYCNEINRKIGTSNMLNCTACTKLFCYICNKPISGIEHYQGKATCHEESQHYQDF